MQTKTTSKGVNEALPSFLSKLSHLNAIGLTGEQSTEYLQGQVSNDIDALSNNNTMLGCHCDAKGKTLSVFNTILWQDTIIMIMHQGSFQASFDALKKFGVFAKTDIQDKSAEFVFLGGKGPEAEAIIMQLFDELPEASKVQSNQFGFAIRFEQPETRYLVALTHEKIKTIGLDEIESSKQNDLWQLMDIQAGIPQIDSNTSAEFIPQMMNLQALNAISFTKGCFMGQETIARNKYLGKNKRAGFILVANEKVDVENGNILERQVGESWRRGGTVLSSCAYNDETWLLAVLPNDTNINDTLRLKETPDVPFNVKPLPYSLEE